MAGDEDKIEPPIGQVLFQNLTKALLDNTNAHIASAAVQKELTDEIRMLREDIESAGGMTEELCTHLSTYLRILDHVALNGQERPPRWKDVQEVLQEIKDEIAEAEAEAEREEREEREKERTASAPSGGSEIFPRKKTS